MAPHGTDDVDLRFQVLFPGYPDQAAARHSAAAAGDRVAWLHGLRFGAALVVSHMSAKSTYQSGRYGVSETLKKLLAVASIWPTLAFSSGGLRGRRSVLLPNSRLLDVDRSYQ